MADDPTQTAEETGTEEQSTETRSTEQSSGSWMDNLSDDLKESESLRQFGSVDDLARSYTKTKAMVGANTVKVPGKNATDDERQEFYQALGVPDDPDQYELPTDGIPDDVETSDEFIDEFKKKAHEFGMTPEQVAGLYRWWQNKASEVNQQSQQQFEQQAEQTKQSLRKEWGEAFDKRIEAARNVVNEFGDEDAVNLLEQGELGNHPSLVRMLAKIGVAVGQDEIRGGGRGSDFGTSPQEALDQIGALKMDQEFMEAYHSPQKPGHREAVQKMNELYRKAYPSEEQG